MTRVAELVAISAAALGTIPLLRSIANRQALGAWPDPARVSVEPRTMIFTVRLADERVLAQFVADHPETFANHGFHASRGVQGVTLASRSVPSGSVWGWWFPGMRFFLRFRAAEGGNGECEVLLAATSAVSWYASLAAVAPKGRIWINDRQHNETRRFGAAVEAALDHFLRYRTTPQSVDTSGALPEQNVQQSLSPAPPNDPTGQSNTAFHNAPTAHPYANSQAEQVRLRTRTAPRPIAPERTYDAEAIAAARAEKASRRYSSDLSPSFHTCSRGHIAEPGASACPVCDELLPHLPAQYVIKTE